MFGFMIQSIEHKRTGDAGAMTVKKEKNMLHRFIDTIRHMAPQSGFEAYLLNLQKNGVIGAPTPSEARKDYMSAIRRETNSII